MRILFLMGHRGYARNFASTISALSGRGHEVVVALDRSSGPDGALADLLARHRGISVVDVPPPSSATRRRTAPARGLRFAIDQLHQLDVAPPGGKAATRAASYLPGPLRPALRALTAMGPRRRGQLARVLEAIARRLAPAPADVAWVAGQRADVMLVTPLVEFGSRQPDKLRAARRLGIPTALLVHSWDNLTTKGRIHSDPDRVIVWNPAQRDEAVSLHGLAPERVTVTGAQAWDHWFDRPTGRRSALCTRTGLDVDATLLVYVCSSPFTAPDEGTAILDWVAAIRGAEDDRLRGAGLIVRPHPANPLGAAGGRLRMSPGVAVFPTAGANPTEAASQSDYFETLMHADAVIGVNTSALLEAAIAGRPAYTVLDERFAATQERAFHFRHVSASANGLLHVAADYVEHTRQLSVALDAPGAAAARSRRFVRRFIRPFGMNVPATPLVVDAIELLAPDRGRCGR